MAIKITFIILLIMVKSTLPFYMADYSNYNIVIFLSSKPNTILFVFHNIVIHMICHIICIMLPFKIPWHT
jgi:hypothetical protein